MTESQRYADYVRIEVRKGGQTEIVELDAAECGPIRADVQIDHREPREGPNLGLFATYAPSPVTVTATATGTVANVTRTGE